MRFSVPHSHPALQGHFPDRPIVPAVLILEAVLTAAGQQRPDQITRVAQAKFTSVLLPDQTCLITLTPSAKGLRFTCKADSRTVATGLLW